MDTLTLLASIISAASVLTSILVAFVFVRMADIAGSQRQLKQSIEEMAKQIEEIYSMALYMYYNRKLLDPIEFVSMVEDMQNRIERVIENEDYEIASEMKKSIEMLMREFKENNPNVEFKSIKTRPYDGEE